MSNLTVRAEAYRGPHRCVAVSRRRALDRDRPPPPRKFPWPVCIVASGFYVEGNRREFGIHSVSQLRIAPAIDCRVPVGLGVQSRGDYQDKIHASDIRKPLSRNRIGWVASIRSARGCGVLDPARGALASPTMLEASWRG